MRDPSKVWELVIIDEGMATPMNDDESCWVAWVWGWFTVDGSRLAGRELTNPMQFTNKLLVAVVGKEVFGLVVVLWSEPRPSCMPDKHSTAKPHPQP